MEKHRLVKKEIGEFENKIDAMGQESEKKAKKWIVEDAKENEKKENKKKDEALNQLDSKRKQVFAYKEYVLQYLHDLILQIRLPPIYQWGVWFDGKGVKVVVIDKFKKRHVRAFRLSYSPKYDINYCYVFAVWVEDIYDRTEGNLAVQNRPSGIWTPTN